MYPSKVCKLCGLMGEHYSTRQFGCIKCREDGTHKQDIRNKNNIYQRNYYRLHTKKYLDKRKEMRAKAKQTLVNMKGGCCSICGYNKCLRALNFHHNDPNVEKKYAISKVLDGHRNRLWRLKPELDKCILLCSNCHMELHEEISKLK